MTFTNITVAWLEESESSSESESDSDDDNDQDEAVLLVLAYLVNKRRPKRRPNYVVNKRTNWTQHVSILHLRNINEFVVLYRMTYPSFVKLCDFLDPFVKVNREMSIRRTSTDPIDTMTIVGTTWCRTDFR